MEDEPVRISVAVLARGTMKIITVPTSLETLRNLDFAEIVEYVVSPAVQKALERAGVRYRDQPRPKYFIGQ